MNKWTDEDKNFVIEQFKKGKTIEDIFNTGKISRSKFAIECKLYGHIYDLLQNGKSHSDVADEFNISKKEVKAIELKTFEMRNKTDTKTMYTNDEGYVYGEKKQTIDLNDFHHVNRTMNTVLNFYENIERLNKLKETKTIDDNFYNDVIKKLKDFTFDKQQIIDSLDINNLKSQTSQIEQNDIKTITIKHSDNKNKDNEEKKYTKKSEDDSDYVKKIKKRMI